MDESSMTKHRRARRSPVLLTATVEVDGKSLAVKLRNLSEQGALIEGDRLPPEGSPAWFERKGLRCGGRIVWVQGKFAGIAFDQHLRPEEVLRQIPRPKPQAKLDFRRPGFGSRPLTAQERQNLESWLARSQFDLIGD
jgi:hypothetical protein